MVRVLIDNKLCDLNEGFALPKNIFTFDADSLSDIERQRSGKKITITLPSTPTNDAIIGFAADSYTATRFNASHHEGIIEVDGTQMLKGVVHLAQIELTPLAGGRGQYAEYHMVITDGAAHWVNYMAISRLQSTPLGYNATLDATTIEESWSEQSQVKFLPVYRDEYLDSENQELLYPPQRVLTIGDYHPFIAVEGLVEAMFRDFGYTIEGEFVKSELFKSLHMSGTTGGNDSTSAAKLNAMMGFYAGRTSTATTTANFAGRAFLTPLVLTNSLGNIVQTADKEANEAFFSNSEALSISDKGIFFTPGREVNVAFDIYLKYTSTYKILSRYRLQGFDSIYVDTGCDIKFGVLNPYADRRAEIGRGISYRCIIFDFADGDEYRIVWQLSTGGKSYTTIKARATAVTSPSSTALQSCTLQKKNSAGVYEACEMDWALYDGYVTEEVSRDVEITLRTTPEKLSPSKSKDFTKMYLYGAKSGQQITLSEECTLRPVFTSALGYGSKIKSSTILQHNCTQSNLLAALQQMFNLRIFSDKEHRKVLIEPRDDFYTDKVFDWSDRMILSEPIELEDMAAEISKKRILAYKTEGGGAVKRFNNKSDTPLGEWSATTDSYIARDDTARTENLLFCPTLSQTDVSSDASAAALLSIGNRDTDEVGESAIRIVCYKGLCFLPEPQKWGFPANSNKYPFAAFHYPAGKVESDDAAIVGETPAAGPDEGFTLCFEDRDGIQGLHSYYDKQWQNEAVNRKLSLSVRISAEELMALLNTSSEGANIRSLFRFEVDGQPTLYRLQAVKGYDTKRGIAQMVFMQEA